ncbi:MAG TPA: GDSL-type esterase/lipase family protein [Phototrophicaceae bacterium]|nr:GDSL-type esterase/lipase family protein [Phototrophicaceae bacterium]
MKIVFFGDSLTQGTFGVSYVAKVAAALPRLQLINAGVNGDTSLNLCRRVAKAVLAHQPDGVVVMIGVNDAMTFGEPGSRAYYRFVKRVPGGLITPAVFRENMRILLGKLVAAGVRVWVVLPPLEYSPASLAAMRAMNAAAQTVCQEFNLPTLDLLARLVTAPVPPRPAISYRTYQHNLRVALGYQQFDRLRDQGGFIYSFDGLHLTEAGAQIVADEMVHFLRAQAVS